MKYPQLCNSCAKAIASGRCIGCTALENPYFQGNPSCRHGRIPTVQESIAQIHKNLGIQERIKL